MKRMCVTEGCNREAREGRRHCCTCSTRRWREANPMRAAYSDLKQNAKRRKKPFKISFEYYARFCRKYDYIINKGRTKESFHIDCKRNSKGYVPGNLRVITCSE